MNKFSLLSIFVMSSVLLLVQTVRSTKPSSPSAKEEKNPYILQGFDTKKVAQLKDGKTAWDKCWKNKSNTYEVCLTRNSHAEYLTWTNKSIPMTVQMKKYNKSGSISQSWLFDGFGISLYRGAKGKITQSWELPNSTWEYTKSAEGEINQEWEGEEDMDAVQKYRSVIDSWCAVNQFYMGEENCRIYQV